MTSNSPDLPPALVERFRVGRVALFIGAGCSRSSGLPGWEQLLRDLYAEIEKNNTHLNPQNKGDLKAYFKRCKPAEFPDIAERCRKIDPETYNNFMQRVFDPPREANRLKAPDYIAWLRQFPHLRRIITTNFDLLLEDALGSDWVHLTWQDSTEFARFLRDDRKLIFHIHGVAPRLLTLVHTRSEYIDLEGQNGQSAVKYLQRIFEQNTILFVGYGLGDPVIQWVSRAMRVDFGSQPDMYSLVSSATDTEYQLALDQNCVRLVSYAQSRKLDFPKDYDNALKSWFAALAEAAGISLTKEVEMLAMPAIDDVMWIELRKDKIQSIPPVSIEDRCRFFNGEPATWAIVRDGYTAKRKATTEALEQLKQPGFRAVLILGAGGEGKSTILKQIAFEFLEKGYTVFTGEEPNEHMFARVTKARDQTVLVVDNADQFSDWGKLLRLAINSGKSIKFVLAARTNEWRYANSHGLGEQERNLITIPVRKLDLEEITNIAKLVWEAGASKLLSRNDVEHRLKSDTNGFLLAAMLVATKGMPLKEILRDVLRQIEHQARGSELLHALGVVVALESRSNKAGRPFFCSARLFKETLGVSNQQMNALCNNLVGEVNLRLKGGYQVQTRHPAIAEIIFQILFRDEPPILEELALHENLIAAAGRIAKDTVNSSEQKLLSVIPLIYKQEKNFDAARLLFQSGTDADPSSAQTWQAWAVMEKEQGNVGKLDEEHTARWLFKRSTDADLNHAPAWQAWAVMEKEQGNVGELDKEYSARWLFKRGTDADPNHAHVWQAWAVMEKEQGNVGELDKENTARWLFKRGTDADPNNAAMWQAWAIMEKEQGNVGELDRVNTARWLFKRGTDADPNHAHVWQAWAVMEKEQGNVGELDKENTARWLFKRGTDADPNNAAMWQAWAMMELNLNNMSKSQDIIDEGLRRCSGNPELIQLKKRYIDQSKSEEELIVKISILLDKFQLNEAMEILKFAMFTYPNNKKFAELFDRWRMLRI